MKKMVLEAKNLTFKRPSRLIFAHLSFELGQGNLLVIEGPNGSGKSSLLRLLVGLSHPTDGVICFNSRNIQTIRTTYQENIHYLAHTNGIKQGLTVRETLFLTQHLNNIKPRTTIDTVIEKLQLSDHRHTPVIYLSAGQKRKLALAKLFFLPKLLWIMDEPFNSLDTDMQKMLSTLFDEQLSQGGIIILTTHQPFSHPNAKHLRLEIC